MTRIRKQCKNKIKKQVEKHEVNKMRCQNSTKKKKETEIGDKEKLRLLIMFG